MCSVGFIKNFRVRQKRAETGFSAEINGSTAILGAGKILRVCVKENSSAHGGELLWRRQLLIFDFRHVYPSNLQAIFMTILRLSSKMETIWSGMFIRVGCLYRNRSESKLSLKRITSANNSSSTLLPIRADALVRAVRILL